MPVYVDKSRNSFRGMIMCHMLADSVEELHAFAERLGLERSWFQPGSTPHYDLSTRKRRIAIQLGAISIERWQVVLLIQKFRTRAAGTRGNEK